MSTAKTYVLDTSVLLQSPMSLLSFEDNHVVIPYLVLDKIGEMKSRPGEIGSHAKECNRILDALCQQDGASIHDGIATPAGGTIRVDSEKPLPGDSTANALIRTCECIPDSILVTQDENLRVKANFYGIKAERYKHDQVDYKDGNYYMGRGNAMISSEKMQMFAEKGSICVDDVISAFFENGENIALEENMFLVLRNASEPNMTMLGRVSGRNIVKLRYIGNEPVFGIKPENVGQRFALEALLAPASEAPLVLLKGPAGTAKTFLAMAAGLQTTYEKTEYNRILVSRPNTKFDDDIGYLKGSEEDKIGPLIRPVIDNLQNLMPSRSTGLSKDGRRLNDPVADLFGANGVITMQAMAYMRGRSICNTYIVIDEAQNASMNQIFGLITRVGAGSKIVILGDPDQIDHPYLDRLNNGLSFASERMKGSRLCWQLAFLESECTRSELAAEAISRLSIG